MTAGKQERYSVLDISEWCIPEAKTDIATGDTQTYPTVLLKLDFFHNTRRLKCQI